MRRDARDHEGVAVGQQHAATDAAPMILAGATAILDVELLVKRAR